VGSERGLKQARKVLKLCDKLEGVSA